MARYWGTMPDESVENFLRRGYAELNRAMRDPSGEQLTAYVRDWWHQDGVYVNPPDAPEPGEHRGIEAVRLQIWRWVEALPDLQIEPLEIRTKGDRAFVWKGANRLEDALLGGHMMAPRMNRSAAI